MTASELIGELENLGVRLWEEDGLLRYRAPRQVMTGTRVARLREHKADVLDALRRRDATDVLTPDPASRHQPFPLTDVQSSYLLGRSDAFAYGGAGCQAYLEVRFPAFDADAVPVAWQRLVERHDALRTVVHPDGYQRVLEHTPATHVPVADLRGRTPDDQRRAVEETRAGLAGRDFGPDRWPLHELRVSRTEDHVLVHLAIDLLVCDYTGVQLLLGELEQLCLRPAEPLPPLDIGYRDHLIAQRHHRERHAERDRAYWWRRLTDAPDDDGASPDGVLPLAPAPALPLRPGTPVAGPPRFARLQGHLPGADWQRLRRHAAAHGVTPTAALMTAYGEVIGRWSGRPRFTLNLPMFDRLPLHPHTGLLLGDFTDVGLLTADWSTAVPFAARAAAAQAQLWEDLDHRACSGVEVLRELGRRRGRDAALMPVVFTSTVATADPRTPAGGGPARLRAGEIVHGRSRTPQVWIDCQVMEQGDGLLLGWDVRQDVLPDGLAEDAFGAFTEAVRRLAGSGAAWQAPDVVRLPAAQRERRARVNDTARPLPAGLLHDGVLAQAHATPDRPAVLAGETRLTYRQLVAHARRVAGALSAAGVRQGDLVAVVLDTCWQQPVAVLGVLLAGAAYLPLDPGQPAARRDMMLGDAGVTTVLCGPATDTWPSGTRVLRVDDALTADRAAPSAPLTGPDDTAYVIHTSGSTGRPKGVVITHRAAANTVADINERFAVGPRDRVLGLAALGFDLSVYDLFGPLARGGCLVLPDAARRTDPSHWADLVERHHVTVWNSVPAQLQMLDSCLGDGPATALSSLRLALLSGDWIAPALVARVAGRLPGCALISLGGATEAAIWSIVHPITEPPAGPSVPYGTPLANQRWYVLDDALRDAPDLVPGELCVAGAGLAQGYLGDPARTAERFPTHPGTGERLYRTGDVGRYLPDGEIELLGRTDDQVKIRGHRVEPGEVAAVAATHPAVASAVALVTGDRPEDRRLAAFATTAAVAASPVPATTAALAAARDTARAAGAAVDEEGLAALLALADEIALTAMARTLRAAGLFPDAATGHTAAEAAAALGTAPRHARAVRRWLRALAAAGRLRHDSADGRYHGLPATDPVDPREAWPALEELGRRLDYGPDLLRLVRTSSEHLPELLRGQEDPLHLLFPQGTPQVAEAAYRDNLVSRTLNRVAVAGLRELAAARRPDDPLRVLEVGAGVGGTSTELIPALAGHPVDYLFTDISQFFLHDARRRFADHPWVRYGRFDVNAEPAAQGLSPNSFDVVLCANVLHNAKDAGAALRRLSGLLLPGGQLVFMEATVERHPLLVSMEFIEGLGGGFTDVREQQDRTFLTGAEWRELLTQAGADLRLCFPADSSVLAQAGQQLFIAGVKNDRARVTREELTAYLAARLPAHMLPDRLEILDDLPLTANGKTDRERLRRTLPAREAHAAHHPATALPADPLERRITALWADVLGRADIGRDDDFFQLGGDSLLVARVVGRLREEEPAAADVTWEHLLRQMLQRPTVAALAGHLRALPSKPPAATAAAAPEGPVLTPLLGAGTDGPVTVLVHDGTGTLLPYQALLEEYRRVPPPGPVVGLTAASPERYLATDPAQLIRRLGGEYARALLAAGHRDVQVVGYCMGGLIATEVARTLGENGAGVAALTVISCYRPPFEVHEELIAEYAFALSLGVDPASVGFPPDDAALGAAIDAVLAATPGRLPAGALARLDGEFTKVGAAFRALAARTPGARLDALHHAAHLLTGPLDRDRLGRQYEVFRHSLFAVTRHRPEPYDGDLTFLRHTGSYGFLPGLREDMSAYWRRVCLGDLSLRDIDGDHFGCMAGRRAAAVRALLPGGDR